MKARGAAIQGALAVAGLVAAYATWQRGPEPTSQGDAVVLDASKNELERVRYQDGAKFIELSRTGAGELWLKQGSDPSKVPPPPAVPDAGPAPAADAGRLADGGVAPAPILPPAPPPPVVEKDREVRGNERAEKIFERFAPLRASRALGKLGDDKLTELGLKSSDKKLTVKSGGAERTFVVGTSALGLGTPYLRDEKTGEVYLLGGTLISELDPNSAQLVDRRLHTFRTQDFDGFTVKAGGDKPGQREFVQTGGDVPQTAKIAPKTAPDKPDDFVRNWHDKIWTRLIVTDVLGKGEAPASGEPTVAVRIDYLWRGSPKGWLELARGKGGEMFARSENTASWVALHGGATDELIEEARKVVSP